MDIYSATETAYKNGYEAGKKTAEDEYCKLKEKYFSDGGKWLTERNDNAPCEECKFSVIRKALDKQIPEKSVLDKYGMRQVCPVYDTPNVCKYDTRNVECNFYDKCETYENCTVQVLTNSVTGESSVGWKRNRKDDDDGK